MRRLLEFLVYSNLYLAFGAAIVTLTTIFLIGYPVVWEALFIPFSASFFIYSFNRFTDLHEDSISLPGRTSFVKKFGKKMFYFALMLYILAVFLALQRNILTLAFALIPPIGGFFYSYFRLKSLFLIKNILVAFMWGFNVLIVGAFFGDFNLFLIITYLFFTLAFLINTIIFDIKDIKGDTVHRIDTLPVKMGLRGTKSACLAILSALLVMLVIMMIMDIRSLLLLPFMLFLGFYIKNAQGSENAPWWYYGIFVDGEFLSILASLLVMVALGL